MSVLFPYPRLRSGGDALHIIAREAEKSAEPKVKEAARHIRRAADLLYEAARERELGKMAEVS